MDFKKIWIWLAMVALIGAGAWGQKPADDEKARLAIFVSKLFSVDRSAINVPEIKPSPLIAGAREATVTIGSSSLTIFLVGDKMIVGNAYDKDFDPLKALMAKMTLKGRPNKGQGPVTIVEFSEFQ